MTDGSDALRGVGIRRRFNWLIGGAFGGIVGSLLFGVVLWSMEPPLVMETIPALYGMEPGAVGWAFHLGHGLILGAIFGFLVTRDPVLGTLTADVETPLIADLGRGTRFALAGLVYGLAIWAVMPFLVQPAWVAMTGVADPAFPVGSVDILVGHLLYGVLLGGLFSAFVDAEPEGRRTDAPFEEASDSI